MTTKESAIGGKNCSICGVWHQASEYEYGNRVDRSYCRTCDKEEKSAYSRGGTVEARAYREGKRALWKKP